MENNNNFDQLKKTYEQNGSENRQDLKTLEKPKFYPHNNNKNNQNRQKRDILQNKDDRQGGKDGQNGREAKAANNRPNQNLFNYGKNTNETLKIIFLGGIGEIGKNMTALEYNKEIIIIDSGLSFPNEDMPGIDIVIPDITYLKDNASKVKALFLTHGHEDHIGGVPYVLKEFKIPVFGTKLTLALAENKIREHKISDAMLNVVKPGSILKLGSFSIEFLKVTHSISGSLALSITTPLGVIFFTGDFKIDYTPIDNELMDFKRFAEIGGNGVLMMLCDSTNVEREGYTMSERTVGDTLDGIFLDNLDKRIIVATFASNIHRLQQILELAKKHNRKVAFSGRSMINVTEAAYKIGELKFDRSLIVDIEKINKIADKNLVIISTGSQGEPMSALTRMASGEFNKVVIGTNDIIILSASPIPGNEKMVYRVINNLYKKGAKVIYESLEKIHVSGHACVEELKLMHNLIKPKYFIPVHGEARHLIQHKELAMKLGMQEGNVIIADLGSVVEIDSRKYAKLKGNVPAGSLLVDGLGIGDSGSFVLRDRKHLSEDGILVIVIGVSQFSGEITAGPDIISRGIISSEQADMMSQLKSVSLESIANFDLKDEDERAIAKKALSRDLRNYLFKKNKISPMILPIIVES